MPFVEVKSIKGVFTTELEFRANTTRSICIYQFEPGWLVRY
jgi:hypothetical protein